MKVALKITEVKMQHTKSNNLNKSREVPAQDALYFTQQLLCPELM